MAAASSAIREVYECGQIVDLTESEGTIRAAIGQTRVRFTMADFMPNTEKHGTSLLTYLKQFDHVLFRRLPLLPSIANEVRLKCLFHDVCGCDLPNIASSNNNDDDRLTTDGASNSYKAVCGIVDQIGEEFGTILSPRLNTVYFFRDSISTNYFLPENIPLTFFFSPGDRIQFRCIRDSTQPVAEQIAAYNAKIAVLLEMAKLNIGVSAASFLPNVPNGASGLAATVRPAQTPLSVAVGEATASAGLPPGIVPATMQRMPDSPIKPILSVYEYETQQQVQQQQAIVLQTQALAGVVDARNMGRDNQANERHQQQQNPQSNQRASPARPRFRRVGDERRHQFLPPPMPMNERRAQQNPPRSARNNNRSSAAGGEVAAYVPPQMDNNNNFGRQCADERKRSIGFVATVYEHCGYVWSNELGLCYFTIGSLAEKCPTVSGIGSLRLLLSPFQVVEFEAVYARNRRWTNSVWVLTSVAFTSQSNYQDWQNVFLCNARIVCAATDHRLFAESLQFKKILIECSAHPEQGARLAESFPSGSLLSLVIVGNRRDRFSMDWQALRILADPSELKDNVCAFGSVNELREFYKEKFRY